MSYPRVRIKSAKTGVTEIDPEVLVSVPPTLLGFAEQRRGGEFFGNAIYLSERYVWIFGFDDEGAFIAIPTRRS